MKDDQRTHTGVPYGNPGYVTPIVSAESHGKTGDVFAPPYESLRVTPADHTVEDDTYDWKHQAPITPLPELHFDVCEARTVEWAWWGIALQLALIPSWVVTLVFYILANLKWGTLTITAPLLILSIAGLANSIRSLIHFRRSPAPVLSLCLSLIGIGLGLVFMVYFAPILIQRVSLVALQEGVCDSPLPQHYRWRWALMRCTRAYATLPQPYRWRLAFLCFSSIAMSQTSVGLSALWLAQG